MLQAVRTGPDGALLDPQGFMSFVRSNLQIMSGLPPHMVQAVNQGDTEELQRIFRCVPRLPTTLACQFCWSSVVADCGGHLPLGRS